MFRRYYCTPSCKVGTDPSPTLDLYFIEGNKKCETDCKNFNAFLKHYYDPENNECLYSCQ